MNNLIFCYTVRFIITKLFENTYTFVFGSTKFERVTL